MKIEDWDKYFKYIERINQIYSLPNMLLTVNYCYKNKIFISPKEVEHQDEIAEQLLGMIMEDSV